MSFCSFEFAELFTTLMARNRVFASVNGGVSVHLQRNSPLCVKPFSCYLSLRRSKGSLFRRRRRSMAPVRSRVVQMMHRRPRPQHPHKSRRPSVSSAATAGFRCSGGRSHVSDAGDFELAGGVAEDDFVGYGVEELVASDGARTAYRRFLEVAFAPVDHVFEIRYRSRASG